MKCPYCGREMKIPKAPSPAVAAAFSINQIVGCEGGTFRRHYYIQYCGIDNTFQTKSGEIARELAKKGYEVRAKAGSYEIVAKKKV